MNNVQNPQPQAQPNAQPQQNQPQGMPQGTDVMPDQGQPYVANQGGGNAQPNGEQPQFGQLFESATTYGEPLWESTGVTEPFPNIAHTKQPNQFNEDRLEFVFDLGNDKRRYFPIKTGHEDAQQYKLEQFVAVRDYDKEEEDPVTGKTKIVHSIKKGDLMVYAVEA